MAEESLIMNSEIGKIIQENLSLFFVNETGTIEINVEELAEKIEEYFKDEGFQAMLSKKIKKVHKQAGERAKTVDFEGLKKRIGSKYNDELPYKIGYADGYYEAFEDITGESYDDIQSLSE
jgi:hypothetical protein